MTEYDYYLTSFNANEQIRERTEHTRRALVPGQRRRPGRQALARRLHSIADRLET